MDKSKAATLLFVGGFLLYLGVFGTSGFGMKLLALTTGFTDNFDDNSVDSGKWNVLTTTGGTVTESGGCATFVGVGGAWHGGEYATDAAYHMSEADIVVDIVRSGPPSGIGALMVYNQAPTMPISTVYWYQFTVDSGLKASVVKASGGTPVWLVTDVSVSSATGQLKISIHSNRISFSFASSLIYTEVWGLPSVDCYVTIGGYDADGLTGGAALDNFALTLAGGNPTYSDVTVSVGAGQGTTSPAAGHYTSTYLVEGSLTIQAYPASGWQFDYMTRNGATTSSMTISPLGASEQIVVNFKTSGGPTTGTLKVFASYNGAYVVASATVSGPQNVVGSTTTDPNNPLTFTLTSGSYTVSGSYSQGSASPQYVTVPSGGSVSATLNFGGTPPTPPNDFLKIILDTINSTAVRALLTMIGVAITGIGVIGLFTGRGRGRGQYPLPYY